MSDDEKRLRDLAKADDGCVCTDCFGPEKVREALGALSGLLDRNIALRSALLEALDSWESLWTSDNNDDPPPRIAELRKLTEGQP